MLIVRKWHTTLSEGPEYLWIQILEEAEGTGKKKKTKKECIVSERV